MHSHDFPNIDDMNLDDAKDVLRSHARNARARRTIHQRAQLAEQWNSSVLRFVGKADIVAAYVSMRDEPDTRHLLDLLVGSGKKVLLPKLGPSLQREWAWYRGANDLCVQAPGRPPEPSGRSLPSEVLADVHVMIIPALLVDASGHRLGRGGGWYDRILKNIRPGTRVGAMIYPEEFVDFQLPHGDLDCSVGYVLLPDTTVECTKASQ